MRACMCAHTCINGCPPKFCNFVTPNQNQPQTIDFTGFFAVTARLLAVTAFKFCNP